MAQAPKLGLDDLLRNMPRNAVDVFDAMARVAGNDGLIADERDRKALQLRFKKAAVGVLGGLLNDLKR